MKSPDSHRGRGVYLLPNLLTTLGLFAAFYAVIAALKGLFETASIAIFIAMLADSLDGRLARLTDSQSEFGAQYDSLADMVSFGITPSIVVYSWGLQGFGKLGWLAAFLYTATTALRLARFNTNSTVVSSHYFQGLPCPAAAGLIASTVWLASKYPELMAKPWLNSFSLFVTVAAGLLMISNVPYDSFKRIDFKGRVPFMTIFIMLLIVIGISIDPPTVLFAGFFIYAAHGPVTYLKRRVKKQRKKS